MIRYMLSARLRSFHSRLSAQTKLRGLSQEALAHECGINRTYLSAVERAGRDGLRQQARRAVLGIVRSLPLRSHSLSSSGSLAMLTAMAAFCEELAARQGARVIHDSRRDDQKAPRL